MGENGKWNAKNNTNGQLDFIHIIAHNIPPTQLNISHPDPTFC